MDIEEVHKQRKNKQKTKRTSSSGTYKTRYHNGSYLLQLGKRKLLSFEIS